MKLPPDSSLDHMQKPDRNGPDKHSYSLTHPGNIATLLVFLAVAFGGGTVIGVSTLPGDWYEGLIKPSFNPPNWIFGPVWSLLYVAIAVAGWRCWQRDRVGPAMKVWFVQMLANFVWSPVFFAAHRIDLALGVIVLLLVAIAAFIQLSWRRDRVAALLFAPYAVWVAFASTLNVAILLLN